MAKQWFFFCRPDDSIVMRCRAEGDGIIGDSFKTVKPGDDTGIPGVDYNALRRAGGGVVSVSDAGATIKPTKDSVVAPRTLPPISDEEQDSYCASVMNELNRRVELRRHLID
jgi:hypothetical protein